MVAIICNELAARIADEESTREAITYLEKFGKDTAKQVLKEATEQVVMSLSAVGKAAAANRLEAVCKAATENELEAAALAALSSKEIVETTIHDYELKLKESDRSTYLKCKKLYVQELEK